MCGKNCESGLRFQPTRNEAIGNKKNRPEFGLFDRGDGPYYGRGAHYRESSSENLEHAAQDKA